MGAMTSAFTVRERGQGRGGTGRWEAAGGVSVDASVDHHTGGRAKEAARAGKLGRPGGEAQLAVAAGWQESQGLLLSFWISVYLNKQLQ